MSNVVSPGSAAEALRLLESAMGYLYTGAAQMAAGTQAECLAGLERLDAIETAARAAILGSFAAGQGHAEDACYSARTWLRHQTRITRAAAAGHVGWARRAAAHPQVMAALAEGWIVSESYARELCKWTDRLPEDCRAGGGCDLDLGGQGRDGPAGSGRAGRRDDRAVPLRGA